VKKTSRHSARRQRRVAKVGQNRNICPSKDQIPATHGQAAEAAVGLAVLRKEAAAEVEAAIAAEVVAKASVDEEAVVVEAKEADGAAAAVTEVLMPMLVGKVTAEGAWSIRTTMRYPVVEAREVDEVAVAGTETSMPTSVIVMVEGAWTIGTMMRYPTGGKLCRSGNPYCRNCLAPRLKRRRVGGVAFASSLHADVF
jgi:hypothetical protein